MWQSQKKWWWSASYMSPKSPFHFSPQFSRWFFCLPSHFIRASTKALIACLAKSGGGPPESGWRTSFGRNLFGPNFFTNFLGGPLGSGTFLTFNWGCNSFPQRVVVGLPSGASRCLLVGIALGWGFIGLEDCFFSSCSSKHRRLWGLSMFKKQRMSEKGRNDVEYQYILILWHDVETDDTIFLAPFVQVPNGLNPQSQIDGIGQSHQQQ